MEFLKAIYGDKALTYEELIQAINTHNGDEANKDKQIKIANLNSGEYVSKLKYEDISQQLSRSISLIKNVWPMVKSRPRGRLGRNC